MWNVFQIDVDYISFELDSKACQRNKRVTSKPKKHPQKPSNKVKSHQQHPSLLLGNRMKSKVCKDKTRDKNEELLHCVWKSLDGNY